MTIICNKCNKNQVPHYRKTKCDECAKADEVAYKAIQQIPAVVAANSENRNESINPPVEKPNVRLVPEHSMQESSGGSLSYTKTLAANSYEVGVAGDRHKIYYETVEELNQKIFELRKSGFAVGESNPFKPEHVPHNGYPRPD